MVSSFPFGLFVDSNNNFYVAETSNNRVQIWSQGGGNPIRNVTNGLNSPHSVCITVNGNMYVDSYNNQVDMWTTNATSGVMVMSTPGRCTGLFVDTNNTVYCSMDSSQRVIAISLISGANTTTTVAGNGTLGSTASLLHGPNGIVVDLNFTLYVADWGNNRIQRFWHGQLNATTVVGTGANGTTITLNHPTGVAVDSNQYLYIADNGNNRIVGSGPYGFRCVIGCSGSSGSSPSQLNEPQNLGFDTYGNIIVCDAGNNRIQKFLLTNNSCAVSG
jgi:sugar lactone lactonase YvrE